MRAAMGIAIPEVNNDGNDTIKTTIENN